LTRRRPNQLFCVIDDYLKIGNQFFHCYVLFLIHFSAPLSLAMLAEQRSWKLCAARLNCNREFAPDLSQDSYRTVYRPYAAVRQADAKDPIAPRDNENNSLKQGASLQIMTFYRVIFFRKTFGLA
jgi:hypothetical protein